MSERQGTDLHHLSVSQSETTCGSPSFLWISSKLQNVASFFLQLLYHAPTLLNLWLTKILM